MILPELTARLLPSPSVQERQWQQHLGRDQQHPYPDRRRARPARPGRQPEVAVDPSAVGLLPEGVRGKVGFPNRAPRGIDPGNQAARLVCPYPDSATWAGSPAGSSRPGRSRTRLRGPPEWRAGGHPAPGPGIHGAQPWGAADSRVAGGGAVWVGPPRGAVRHSGRQRGGRAVRRTPRSPTHHPGLGDHPPGPPHPPTGRPTRQPRRAPPHRSR